MCGVGIDVHFLTAILVVYPKEGIGADVYAVVLGGMQNHQPSDVIIRSVDTVNAKVQIIQHIEEVRPKAIITLGLETTEATDSLPLRIPHVIGGLVISPQTRPANYGISLITDPKPLFALYKKIAPDTVDQLHVVYDPGRFQWLIDQATQTARDHGLVLRPHPATSLSESVRLHETLVTTINPSYEAMWLLWDSYLVDRELVLPTIIEASWQRQIIVISNNLNHIRYNVLLSVYPDLESLGKRLLALAERATGSANAAPTIIAAQDTVYAINQSAAQRLGLSINNAILRNAAVRYGR